MSLPISAVEFLQSERTSNGVVLLKDEDINNVVGSGNATRVRMENATRVALVLTRSFIQFSVLPELRNGNGAVDLSFLILDDFFVTFEERSIHEGVKENDSHPSSCCIVLGIDNLSPERLNQKENDEENSDVAPATPMQVLGKLLYTVFSFGQSPPAHLLAPEQLAVAASHDRQSNGLSDGRSSKSPRPTEMSVFSTLVRGELFPASICRLLSNLIDIGPNGKSDCQFTKFEDVIEDLQQMIAKPELLLHDSTSTVIELDVPMFGHLYHGRKNEFEKLMSVATQIEQSTCTGGVQAMFISGIAGSGKSSLVGAVSEKLLSSGWIIAQAKFERSVEKSRCVVLSMFDDIINYLVKMKESEVPSNVAYCNRVSKAIMEAFGQEALSGLVCFLPKLALLFDIIQSTKTNENEPPATEADWQLVYSLSKILEAVLESDRYIMVCCDDLHWAERGSFSLIAEVLINLGGRDIGKRIFFTGIYRGNEITDDDHPFFIQYSYLQMSSSINVNEMKLSSLGKEDILEMIQQQFKLPRRYLAELADVTHKKSGGHALYAVTLLNTLLRDSIITFSSQKRRFFWDNDRISFIETGDDVAELIASNLQSLTPMCQRALRIIACFGIQTDLKLLRYLDRFEKGTLVLTSLKKFVERGILDRAGPLVIFCHDLILQASYNSMSLAEKNDLHLRLGQYLGTIANASLDPVSLGMSKLEVNGGSFFAGRSLTSSLISISCDQVNCAGPQSTSDRDLKVKFAKWNLVAGQESSSDFLAALHYYAHGILFLESFGHGYWSVDAKLCLALHNGAVQSAFALGEHDKVATYAREVTKHAIFEDTLEAQAILLKSLNQISKVEECLTIGVDILRRLNFDIPLSPSYPHIMQAIGSTEAVASQFSFDQIVNLRNKVMDHEKRKIGVIMDAFMGSCYSSKNNAAFLPIISCEIVKFALTHGIFPESTSAFASYAMMRIFNQGDYEGAKKWARIVRAVTEKREISLESTSAHRFDVRSHIILYAMVDVWFYPARDLSKHLVSYCQNAMKMGQIDVAMVALQSSWTYMILGGESLPLISQHVENQLQLVVKHSAHFARYCSLDIALLYTLIGKLGNSFTAFQSSILSIEDLLSEALAQSDTNLLHRVHFYSFMIAYWNEDFVQAEEHSHKILKMFPVCKMPTIYLLYLTFFRGLVAFNLFRTLGGDNRLKEGVDAINEFEKWVKNSKPTFHNKLLLLQAEHEASKPENRQAAIPLYEESIQFARDHGNIHELALSHKLFGDYYASDGNLTEAVQSWQNAHVHFKSWGATAVADRLMDRCQLKSEIGLSAPSPPMGNGKREWESIDDE